MYRNPYDICRDISLNNNFKSFENYEQNKIILYLQRHEYQYKRTPK